MPVTRIPLPATWWQPVMADLRLAGDMKNVQMSGPYATVAAGAEKALSVLPGQVKVFASAGNGSRPVICWVPDTFDPDRPATVVTYFAGKGFNWATDAGANGLLSRLRTVKSDDNAVYIFPQGHLAEPTDRWMRKEEGESFELLQREANLVLRGMVGGVLRIGARTVVAHSGGGSAVHNAVRSGELRADRLLLLDCFYETRGENWWVSVGNWIVGHPDTDVTYYYATNERQRVKEFTDIITPHAAKVAISKSSTWHGGLPAAHFSPKP